MVTLNELLKELLIKRSVARDDITLVVYNKTTGERYQINDIDITSENTIELNIFTHDEEEE